MRFVFPALADSRVYVGGLSWDTTNDTLKAFFEGCGTVTDAFIVQDRETGRSKGSCLSVMSDHCRAVPSLFLY